MNKITAFLATNLLILSSVSLPFSVSYGTDADKPTTIYVPARQKSLLEMKVEEKKQQTTLQTKHKTAAWFANKAAQLTGTLYGLQARITAPLLLSSSGSFHQHIFEKELKRRNQLVNWICKDFAETDKKDFARIQAIADLAAWQGHSNAFNHNVDGWSYSLATDKKLNVMKSTNPYGSLLKMIKYNNTDSYWQQFKIFLGLDYYI